MKALPIALALLVVFTCVSSHAAEENSSTPAVSVDEATAALKRAGAAMRQIAAEGGYLWRYSTDMRVRAGEGLATPTQVWVQPPGTPAMGQAFLEMWRATHDPEHLEGARAAAVALARGQLQSGGWDYLIEFDPAKRAGWRYRVDEVNAAGKARNTTTFDDDNTQSALRFLLDFLSSTQDKPEPRDAAVREALDYGLSRLIEAQYPNGAWPQRWDGKPFDPASFPVVQAVLPEDYPREQPSGSYYAHYTFNDGAHRDLVITLVEAWRKTGRAEYEAAARRGGDFLLLAQLPEPQPGWAQQYDAGMRPAWARAFEPPAVSGGESAGVIRLLVDLYLEFGDDRYLAAVPPAVAWLRRSEVEPGRWARLYELHSNRPIYGDRDGRIHATLEEVSEERRTGYAWQGGFGVASAIAHYEKTVARGRDAMLRARNKKPLDAASRRAAAAEMTPEVRKCIQSLDAQGRWVTNRLVKRIDPTASAWIETKVFIENAGLLCEYLEVAGNAPAAPDDGGPAGGGGTSESSGARATTVMPNR